MTDPKACSACNRTDNAPSELFPIVGMICRECYFRLAQPTLLAGAVEGPSILTVCRASVREFDERRERLRRQAREICGRRS